MLRRIIFVILCVVISACANQPQNSGVEDELFTVESLKARANNAYHYGNQAEALFSYDEILRVSPNDIDALIGKGEVYLSFNEPYEAEKYFARALEQEPQNIMAREGRAICLLMLGESASSETAFKKIIDERAGMWRSLNALGVLSDLKGDYDSAIQYYQESMKYQPNKLSLYNNLGYSFIMSRRYSDAEKILNQGMLLDSNDQRLVNNLAISIAWQGRYDDAVSLLSSQLKPEHSYNNIGYIAYLRGDCESAIKLFKEALTKSPSYYRKADMNMEIARKKCKAVQANK